MAKRKPDEIPDYNERQKILYIDETAPEELGRIADLLLNENRFSEAYDYLERMDDEERLRLFLEGALKKGDFFNFDRAARKLDMEVAPEEWEKLGNNAAGNELFRNAFECYRRSGNREKADRIMQENPDLFGPALEMDRFEKPETGESAGEKIESMPEPIPEKTAPPPPKPKPQETPAQPKDPELAAKIAALRAKKKKWKKKKKK